MKHFILLFIFLVSTTSIIASSIIGGDLTYEKVGTSSYKVQLRLYRDCSTGNDPFPSSVKIKVRRGLGVVAGLDFIMPRTAVNQTNLPIDSCSFSVCVEEALYNVTVSLPLSTDGYHLYYGYWGRDAAISNISNPQNTGIIIKTYIPNESTWPNNSSPSWSHHPDVVICQGQNFSIDQSATDINGDSLVYSLYTPYGDTIPAFNNSIPVPNNIQFPSVSWGTGYTANNPFNSSGTILTIDPNTGILTGVAEDLGQYIVGIKCEEFRSGIKIGEIVRDYQYQVFDCSSSKEAIIGHLNGCNGNIIQMINDSPSGASNFYWDFGDYSAPSTDDAPIHNFPGTGDFLVTLIAQYGTPCADTTTQLLKIAVVFASFNNTIDSTCIDTPISFTNNSQAYGNMVIDSILWDFADSTTSINPNPTHTFNASGNLNVTLTVGTDAGCFNSYVKTIFVQGLPDVDVGPDTAACYTNPNAPLNGIINNASGGMWTGNGGTFSPNSYDLNATYIPSPSEIFAGQTQIILHSTGNGLCPSSSDTLHITFIDHPTIDVGPNLVICSDTTFIPLNATTQFSNGVEWNTTNGSGSFINQQSANSIYIPSAVDLSLDSIQFIAKTINNGGCSESSDTLWIKFTMKPSINFIYTDTVCENVPIHLNAYSVLGVTGIWSTNGDGTFTTPNLHITDYNHGPLDLNAQTVEIYFKTTNNGACSTQYDTLDITIIPSPNVDFTTNQVCYGTPTIFTSNISSSVPTSTYSWSTNNMIFSTAKDTSYILPLTDTNEVIFIAYTPQGCSDTIKKIVTTLPTPIANFNIDNPCSNSNTQFLDSSYAIGGTISSWKWDFGDGATDTSKDPNHLYNSGTNYNVQLIVTSLSGCIDSITKAVSIFSSPIANFSATPKTTNVGDEITFVDLSTTNYSITYWEWDFKDGNFSYDKNTSHSYNQSGKYDVSLYIEDSNGCSDTTHQSIAIRVKPSIPTAFSPNGDGNNDILMVYGGPYETLNFKVYNNWGQVIFQTNDILQGWDGTFKGDMQPIGVYVWSLKATTNDGIEYEISGDVSLIR